MLEQKRPRLKPDAGPGNLLKGPSRTYGHVAPSSSGYRSLWHDATITVYSKGGIFFHWNDLTAIITREDAFDQLRKRDEYGEREWERER